MSHIWCHWKGKFPLDLSIKGWWQHTYINWKLVKIKPKQEDHNSQYANSLPKLVSGVGFMSPKLSVFNLFLIVVIYNKNVILILCNNIHSVLEGLFVPDSLNCHSCLKLFKPQNKWHSSEKDKSEDTCYRSILTR